MTASTYRQVELVKGAIHQVVWIPLPWARPGCWLRLKGENGWRVGWVGGWTSEEHLKAHEHTQRVFPSLQ